MSRVSKPGSISTADYTCACCGPYGCVTIACICLSPQQWTATRQSTYESQHARDRGTRQFLDSLSQSRLDTVVTRPFSHKTENLSLRRLSVTFHICPRSFSPSLRFFFFFFCLSPRSPRSCCSSQDFCLSSPLIGVSPPSNGQGPNPPPPPPQALDIFLPVTHSCSVCQCPCPSRSLHPNNNDNHKTTSTATASTDEKPQTGFLLFFNQMIYITPSSVFTGSPDWPNEKSCQTACSQNRGLAAGEACWSFDVQVRPFTCSSRTPFPVFSHGSGHHPWDGLPCRHVEGHTCPQCSVCVYAADCMHILQGISASPLHPQRDSYSGEGPCQKPSAGSSNSGGTHTSSSH